MSLVAILVQKSVSADCMRTGCMLHWALSWREPQHWRMESVGAE